MNDAPQGLPQTRESLSGDLRALGVEAGQTVLLHSSLRSLGWVCGGAPAVVLALLDVLGPHGTLVVPTQTSDNSDPRGWGNPPVPEHWWPIIREHLPGFDPAVTPSRFMGAIAEQVRTWPGAVRSAHPQTSFAALGARAAEVVERHPFDCRLGPDSPLGTLERMGAAVLLLGVGYDRCTCFHLAEYRVPSAPTEQIGSAVLDASGQRRWATATDVAIHEDDFPQIGSSLRTTGLVRSGSVGAATGQLFALSDAVAHATSWLLANRHAADR